RKDFPEVWELIIGNFERHSPEFYQWRIQYTEAKLKTDPKNLALYDDLAVAYSKLDFQDKAIAVILEKEKIKPGLYTTYANLGTFYLHQGALEKGIEYIDKALEINPEAHFGRERYQKYLAEYVLSKKKDGQIKLPLSEERGFYIFVYKKEFPDREDYDKLMPKEALDKAVQGILGMMRFGNYDSPILLEALGDLLMQEGTDYEGGFSARQLACRAYLKASKQVNDPISKQAYRDLAQSTIFEQQDRNGSELKLKDVEKQLQREIKMGKAYFEMIRQSELSWIKQAKDPDFEYDESFGPILPEKEEPMESPSLEIAEIEEVEADQGNAYAIRWLIIGAIVFLVGGLALYNYIRQA
ncbi:MAG: hypothetical protein AAFU64_08120, partial [Bacteroidota bacterium]